MAVPVPSHTHGPPRFERRVNGVAHQDHQQLLELIGIGLHGNRRARFNLNGLAHSSRATRSTSAEKSISHMSGRGSRASAVYADVNRLSASVLPAMIPKPRRMSSRQSAGIGSWAAMLSRLPAIDLIGATKLLSSWPSTRMRRCQASRSCWRSGTLTSLRTTSVCGGRPAGTIRGEPATGRCRRGKRCSAPGARCRRETPQADFVRGSSSSCSTGGRAAVRPRDRPAEACAHRRTQRRRHRSRSSPSAAAPSPRASQPLVPQRVGQGVDLEQRVAERVVARRASRAKGEVVLPQRLEQVRHRLQREDDAVAKR